MRDVLSEMLQNVLWIKNEYACRKLFGNRIKLYTTLLIIARSYIFLDDKLYLPVLEVPLDIPHECSLI